MVAASQVVDDSAARFHERALVLDLHNDLLLKLVLRGGDLSRRHGAQWIYNPLAFDIDLPKLKAGGVDGIGCLLFAGFNAIAKKRFWLQLERFKKLIATHDELVQARSAADVRAAKANGKIALWLGVEGALPLEEDAGALARLKEAGVLFLGPLWNRSNKAGTSSADRSRADGLSDFGRALVEECNRLGVLIDVSHASKRTCADLIECSHTPVFSSHSGCAALKDHHRNLDDDQLRAIGKRGGVVGVIFAAHYLGGLFSASVETICDHIEHVVRIAGEDAVALGSDFDGFVPLPRGMRDTADMPRITDVLWRRGFGEARLRKLLGENFLSYLERTT